MTETIAQMQGKIAVVTGGTQGLGARIAALFAERGAAGIVICGRNRAKGEAKAEEIARVSGAKVIYQQADLENVEDCRAVIAVADRQFGRIDALVNNAGGQFMSPLESICAKGWEAVLHTNLTGGFLMARECYRQWMAQHGGSIVNIVADMWGSMPGMGHSGAARAGMVSFTETAALEWAHSGVRVNAVAPGYIASSGMDNYPPEAADMLRAMPRTVPLGRFGNEAEVSAAITFLLSPAASFISGTTLRVDGARPQVRMGWPQRPPGATAAAHPAVRPFDGFHRAQVPQVFAPSHTPKTEAA